jgi:hypothetical protein
VKCRQGKGFVAFLAKQVQDFERIVLQTHIPHPKLSQREITERKNQSEHKNKHKERKKAFEKQ